MNKKKLNGYLNLATYHLERAVVWVAAYGRGDELNMRRTLVEHHVGLARHRVAEARIYKLYN